MIRAYLIDYTYAYLEMEYVKHEFIRTHYDIYEVVKKFRRNHPKAVILACFKLETIPREEWQ